MRIWMAISTGYVPYVTTFSVETGGGMTVLVTTSQTEPGGSG
jgi:hypothetical protein